MRVIPSLAPSSHTRFNSHIIMVTNVHAFSFMPVIHVQGPSYLTGRPLLKMIGSDCVLKGLAVHHV
jgi:hypothetical protein